VATEALNAWIGYDLMSTYSDNITTAASTTEEIVAEIRSFVVRRLERPVADDEDFFKSGMVSSLFGMQLITFLENSFNLEVADEDLLLDNFASIANISCFVARKMPRQ